MEVKGPSVEVDIATYGFIKLKRHLARKGYSKIELDNCADKHELLALHDKQHSLHSTELGKLQSKGLKISDLPWMQTWLQWVQI